MAIGQEAKARGCSQAELIEGWATGCASVVERPIAAVPVPQVSRSLPAGVVLGSQLTDRSNAKPLTRAVQKHEARLDA